MSVVGIGIIAGFFFLGYIIGLYEGRWKHGKKLKALQEELAAARDKARQEQEKAAALREENQALKKHPQFALSLEETSSGIQVSLDGKVLQPQAMTDMQHKRLLSVLAALTPYIKRQQASAAPPKLSASRPPTLSSARRVTVQPQPAVLAETDDMPPGLSIVQQIDYILQKKIKGTALASMGIRLSGSMDGGVIVWVGMNRYEGVGAVPDPTVKAVIQEAIAEWEQLH